MDHTRPSHREAAQQQTGAAPEPEPGQGSAEAGDLPSIEALRQPVDQGLTRPLAWRRRQLQALAALMEEEEEAILEALHADLGKPPVEAYVEVASVRQELRLSRQRLKRWMAPRPVPVPLVHRPGRASLRPEPLGCVLIMGPWNYPLLLMLRPLVSALAAGNTAVLKPSEHAPHTAALLERSLRRHLGDGVVQVVQGGPETAQALLQQRFDHIFFTGGGRVGKLVMRAAAEQLTPVTLELGGRNPAIVLADADLAVTARRLAWGKGLNAGQTCIAPDHLLVEESVRPGLITRLQEAFTQAYGDNPLASPDLARLVNRAQYERLEALLRRAQARGQVLWGGQCDPERLRIVPAVLAVDRFDDPLMAEELFGPLLPLLSIQGLEAAVTAIRRGPKPLAIYLFSHDRQAQERLLATTSSGGVCFNDVVMQAAITELPFGGVGGSGMGRYHGQAGFDTFSHLRSVLERPFRLDLPFRYPPYGNRLALIKRLMG